MIGFQMEDLYEEVRSCYILVSSKLSQEVDAGLGNGGLGRLAACFLDSLATMYVLICKVTRITGMKGLPCLGLWPTLQVWNVQAAHPQWPTSGDPGLLAPER